MDKTYRLLPPNLSKDKNLLALCEAIDTVFETDKELNKLLVYIIDNAPPDVLPFLAWQFRAIGFEFAKTDEQKRALIKKAIQLHRYKGTKWAVKGVLDALGLKGELKEWFEYNGEPYKFKLYLDSIISNEGIYTDLVNLINQYKNERSWLDSIGKHREINTDISFSFAKKSGFSYVIGLSFSVNVPEKHCAYGCALRKSFQTKVGISQPSISIPGKELFYSAAFRYAKKISIGVANG